MAGINAEASWFCCGNAWGPCGTAGHGACGTCNSGNMQHAWPNTSDGCYAITHPDTCGITGMSRRTCGFQHATTSMCTGKRIVTSIADCGPQTDLFCGERSCCGGKCASNRVIDFTPAAFTALTGSLQSGLTPVTINAA